MKVIYQGISKEDAARQIEDALAKAYPPEKRGEEKKYEIDRDDPERIKERKREARKAWFAMKRKDIENSIAKDDAEREVYGQVFKKGVPTEINPKSDLLLEDIDPKTRKPTGKPRKIDTLIVQGVFVEQKQQKQNQGQGQG